MRGESLPMAGPALGHNTWAQATARRPCLVDSPRRTKPERIISLLGQAMRKLDRTRRDQVGMGRCSGLRAWSAAPNRDPDTPIRVVEKYG